MDINDILSQSSGWVRGNLSQIANSIVITLLAVYGNDLNRFVKNKVKDKNILIRYIVFIVFMSFGYGFLTVFLLPYIVTTLQLFGNLYLAPVTVGVYLLICFLATTKKQI
jgi:hypothetical protein